MDIKFDVLVSGSQPARGFLKRGRQEPANTDHALVRYEIKSVLNQSEKPQALEMSYCGRMHERSFIGTRQDLLTNLNDPFDFEFFPCVMLRTAQSCCPEWILHTGSAWSEAAKNLTRVSPIQAMAKRHF